MVDQGRATYLDHQAAPWIERATRGVTQEPVADLTTSVAAITDPTQRSEAERLLRTVQRGQAARSRSKQRRRDKDN